MNNIVINIARDYTQTPGGRYISEGPYSGEEFRKNILRPEFERFIFSEDCDMTVILDGGYGYAPSFLEEAFGGLAHETQNQKIRKIKIISDEEPEQLKKIKGYINGALEDKNE